MKRSGMTPAEKKDMKGWDPPDDKHFALTYPSLFEHLTCAQWEDGSPRETSTCLILVESGFFKAQLRDRAEQRCLWRAGATLEDLWINLELAVSDRSCGDWRPFENGWTGKRKK